MRTLTAACAAFLAACASASSVQYLPAVDAGAVPDTSRARVVVMREKQAYGEGFPVLVTAGGADAGSLASGGYLCFDAAPGSTAFSLILDRKVVAGGRVRVSAERELKAGETCYLRVRFDTGKPTMELQLDFLEEAAARALLPQLTPAPGPEGAGS